MAFPNLAPVENGSTWLQIRGATANNLQHVDLDIPLHQLCVVTGVSGCGKSSLAIDTIATEGQRRFLDVLALGRSRKNSQTTRRDVLAIHHLPPTVLVGNFGFRQSPQTTMAILTDIWPLLQTLFIHAGTFHCPTCGEELHRHQRQDILQYVLGLPEKTRFLVLAGGRRFSESSSSLTQLESIAREGYVRVRVDGKVMEIAAAMEQPAAWDPVIEAVVDRLVIRDGLPPRLDESLDAALQLGQGTCLISHEEAGEWIDTFWSTVLYCRGCCRTWNTPDRETLDWKNPASACPECRGSGHVSSTTVSGDSEVAECPSCRGARLNSFVNSLRIGRMTLIDVLCSSVSETASIVETWTTAFLDENRKQVTQQQHLVASRVLPSLRLRVGKLLSVGLDYLTWKRSAQTLSRGEYQRVRLASTLGERAQGMLFVYDEPCSGLHPRDIERLIDHLRELCRNGNSVIAVEHRPEFIAQADWGIDLGPGAGPRGGRILENAKMSEFLLSPTSLTVAMLRARVPVAICPRVHSESNMKRPMPSPAGRSPAEPTQQSICLKNAHRHQLQHVTLEIPAGTFCGVAGVSGSGKTSLLLDCLAPLMRHQLAAGKDQTKIHPTDERGMLVSSGGVKNLVVIEGKLPGRSRSATPATLTGIWGEFRRLYARTKEARRLGWSSDRFSYLHPESRCPRCRGIGRVRAGNGDGTQASRNCPECRGRRYQQRVQAVTFKGLSIADVLALSIERAYEHFSAIPRIASRLELLMELGLAYLPLGQTGDTLSSGELQRLFLGRFLRTSVHEPTLLICDEPTAGLHVNEICLLSHALRRLTSSGHTVVAIEHSLELLRETDWIIELGPESGPQGGRIVAEGTPAQFADEFQTWTARAFRGEFASSFDGSCVSRSGNTTLQE